MLAPSLEHARYLGRGRHEIRQLVEDEGASPARGFGVPGQAGEQAGPVRVVDGGEARQSRRDGFRQIAALDLGRRLVRHGLEAAGLTRPREQQSRLADAAPPVDHNEAGLSAARHPPEAGDLLSPVEKLHHYAR